MNTQTQAPLNLVILKSGRARALCQYCGRASRPISGRVNIDSLPLGWWTAPFPPNYVHESDGSEGSLYTCPACAKNPIGLSPCRTRGIA